MAGIEILAKPCGTFGALQNINAHGNRIVCKNGLIRWEESRRKYHVGDKRKASQDFSHALEVYCDETRKAMDKSLWLQVADNVRCAISETFFEASLGKMRAAKGGEPIAKPDAAMEMARRVFSLTEVDATAILSEPPQPQAADLSRFDHSLR